MACCTTDWEGPWCCTESVDAKEPIEYPIANERGQVGVHNAFFQSKEQNGSMSTHSNHTQSSYASFGQDYAPLARPALGSGVNFSGTWRCIDVQGDIVRFLQDLGLEEEEAANAADAYANLSHTQKIAQVGNTFVIQVMQQENVTTAFRVGAGAQPSSDQVGRALLIDPKWQEEVLVVHSVRADGTLISNSRRYLQGEKMVLCISTPTGSTIKRVFEKLPGP